MSTTEVISIKERIEQLFVSIVAGITGVGKVYRFDQRGIVDPDTGLNVDADGQRLSLQDSDAMIVAGNETATDGGEGNGGVTEKALTIEVHFKIAIPEDDPRTTSYVHNQWLMKGEQAVMANFMMIDAGGVRLAINTDVIATDEVPVEQGQREATSAIVFKITYQHDRTDPSTGPGITAKEFTYG